MSQLLRTGGKDNVIGLWAASGWGRYPDLRISGLATLPLVCAELYVDGLVVASTGTHWKAHASTTSQVGDWGKGGFGGEHVDDRLAQQGWDAPAFDDSHWTVATHVRLPAAIAISADVMEPTIVEHVAVPAVQLKSVNGTHRLVMKEVFTGWIELKNLRGNAGSTVTVQLCTHALAR